MITYLFACSKPLKGWYVSPVATNPVIACQEHLHHYIHHFKLALDDESGIRQHIRSWVFLFEHGIGIFWYVYGREECVLRRVVVRGLSVLAIRDHRLSLF